MKYRRLFKVPLKVMRECEKEEARGGERIAHDMTSTRTSSLIVQGVYRAPC